MRGRRVNEGRGKVRSTDESPLSDNRAVFWDGVPNFRVADKPGLSACWLESKFASYCRVIYPRSVLIRRMWLRAIARKAESR
jgi:hypothetical protein